MPPKTEGSTDIGRDTCCQVSQRQGVGVGLGLEMQKGRLLIGCAES